MFNIIDISLYLSIILNIYEGEGGDIARRSQRVAING